MIDNNVITIAKIQASLFEYSCKMKQCASSFFIKQFLYSNVALRLADKKFIYSCDDICALYEELGNEKKLNVGKEIFPEPIMYWIGYVLSVISFKHNLNPSQIYKTIKPKELYICYEAYHSLDIEDAANRIIESKIINKKNDLELYKKVKMHL